MGAVWIFERRKRRGRQAGSVQAAPTSGARPCGHWLLPVALAVPTSPIPPGWHPAPSPASRLVRCAAHAGNHKCRPHLTIPSVHRLRSPSFARLRSLMCISSTTPPPPLHHPSTTPPPSLHHPSTTPPPPLHRPSTTPPPPLTASSASCSASFSFLALICVGVGARTGQGVKHAAVLGVRCLAPTKKSRSGEAPRRQAYGDGRAHVALPHWTQRQHYLTHTAIPCPVHPHPHEFVAVCFGLNSAQPIPHRPPGTRTRTRKQTCTRTRRPPPPRRPAHPRAPWAARSSGPSSSSPEWPPPASPPP